MPYFVSMETGSQTYLIGHLVGPHGHLLHGHVLIHTGAVSVGGSSWDGKLYALVPEAGQSWEVKVERSYKHRKNFPQMIY